MVESTELMKADDRRRRNRPSAPHTRRGGENMRQPIHEHHYADEDGNPSGGQTSGMGLGISWQDGPLGRGPERKEPNGAFVETVIAAALGRLRFYQDGKFACIANENAITLLEAALDRLESRTRDREVRQVEGTHVA
jgi:hypothetical protein